jgi:hypothetical protein
MSDDPTRAPMIDRPGLQPRGLHPPKAAFDQHHAGIPQRDIRGVEGVVVGRHHELAIILRFRCYLGGIDTQAPACIHPQVASEAA